MSAITQLLQLELLLTLRSRQLLPLFVMFPLIGLALPSLLILLTSKALVWTQSGEFPGLDSVLLMVQSMATLGQLDLVDAMRQLLLRSSATFYVLIPTLILPITASFAVVGERQRGTLEPLLATPISDQEFCLGKLLATVLPAVLITWVAALGGAVLAALLVHADHGVWMWPDLQWLLGVVMLTPLLAILVSLACLWVSIRSPDAQAATQISILVMMPILLLVLVLIGPLMMVSIAAIGWTALSIVLLDGVLLIKVLQVFRREGVLGAA